MKAQVSVEYMVIISVALIALVPFILYSNDMIVNYNEQTKVTLAKNAVEKLGQSADWVYSQGQPAKLTTTVYFPDGITDTSLANKTITIRLRTKSGISDIYYTTISNMNGSIPRNSGYYSMEIVAFQNFVNMSW